MLLRMFVDVYMHAGTANNREKNKRKISPPGLGRKSDADVPWTSGVSQI